MVSTRIAVSAYVGLVVYCLASFFFGPMGMHAYSDLEERVTRMDANLASLEALHERAQSRLQSAQSDPETLAMEALSLGYVAEGEVVVRIGFPEGDPSLQELGTLVAYEAPNGVDDMTLKTIALVAALCVFFISLAIHAPRKARTRRAAAKGSAGAPSRGAVSGAHTTASV